MTLSYLIDVTPKNYSKHVVMLLDVKKLNLNYTCFGEEGLRKSIKDMLWPSAFWHTLKRLEQKIHSLEKNRFMFTMDPLIDRLDQIILFIKLSLYRLTGHHVITTCFSMVQRANLKEDWIKYFKFEGQFVKIDFFLNPWNSKQLLKNHILRNRNSWKI